MLYPQVSVIDWSARYKLEPFESECESCGRLQRTDIPWASGSWRGLKSDVCECGVGCDVSTAIQVDEQERQQWKDIFNYCNNDS